MKEPRTAASAAGTCMGKACAGVWHAWKMLSLLTSAVHMLPEVTCGVQRNDCMLQDQPRSTGIAQAAEDIFTGNLPSNAFWRTSEQVKPVMAPGTHSEAMSVKFLVATDSSCQFPSSDQALRIFTLMGQSVLVTTL